MNRSQYFNYIEDKIDYLSYRIGKRGKINLLDLNIYSETFFAEMINMLLKLNLKNMNAIKQNVEGIDLIDHDNKVVAQVSSTNTKQKIENSLKKEIIKKYKDYRFIFIPIVGDSDALRLKTFHNPHGINFNPEEDIYDTKAILNLVLNMKIGEQQNFYTFIKEELGNEVDLVKVDTNLAAIINILAKENLVNIPNSPQINHFEINRKIEFNNLQNAKGTIDLYKVYYSKLDEKYTEFDKLGTNRSLSVFSVLSNQYIKLQNEKQDDIDIFYSVINNVIEIIQKSKNYVEIPYEELEMCVCIIVVDAFIRCKIFKNPEGYNHVVTG
ncbi:MAG: SMEK domain-containing protein [Treponema sp.]|nr:SMEK domain-containing protein [Treponema sp.]